MTNAKRDENYVPLLLAASSADGTTPVMPWVDPATHRILVDSSTSGLGITDNSAFTAGASSGTPAMGFYHSTIDTVTDGRSAVLAIDSKRNLFTVIRDAAGNGRGVNVDGSNNLQVYIKGSDVSTGGTSAIDNSAFVAGTTTGTPAMGFYHSTIDAVTDGRAATVAITAKRAMMVNLQTSAGAETGVAAVPLQVSLANTAANATAVKVDGSAVTQPVSGTVSITANSAVNLAQVAGTATDVGSGNKSAGTIRVVIATDQPALTNKLLVTPDANSAVNVAQMNGVTVSMGSGTNGTGVQRITLATDQAAVSTAGLFSVKTDQTTHGTTDLVAADITKIAGTAIVNGGVAGSQSIGGTVATNVAITANPINLGAQAVSSENSAVTTARQVQLVADLVGKLIVLPYANPENFVSGVTAAITDTTSTSLIASPGGSLRNYVTHIIATNSHASVSTFVTIRDGSGGTILYEAYALAAGGGFSITLPTPLRQPTTATALHCKCETTGSNVIVSATGYKGL